MDTLSSWDLLEQDPQVGDVLAYALNEMIVVVLRCHFEKGNSPLVDVLWLMPPNDNNSFTTHFGGLSSWKGWRKAPS